MKKFISLLLVPALLFSLCGAVVYAEDGTPDEMDSGIYNGATKDIGAESPEEISPDLTGGLVTKFRYEKIFAKLELESYEKGKLEDLEFLIATITKALDCTVLLPDTGEVSALCTAVWNTEELTLDVAGVYAVTATLAPPDGCAFADGVRREVVIPVQIIDPEGAPVFITEIDAWIANRIAIAVPVGASIDLVVNHVDLEGLRIKGKDGSGNTHNSAVEWDFSTVKMDTPGLYRVTGTLVPPPGLAFAPELTLPEPVFIVSVQTLGSPDINCYSRGRRSLLFPWVLTVEQTEQLDQFEVWMAVDGVWSEPETGYSVFPDHIEILLTNISTEHTYALQVEYPGGQTGILTFTYDGTVLDSDYSEGDRDGGDSNDGGNTLPSTPSPTPKPAPSVADDIHIGSSAPMQNVVQQPPAIKSLAPAPTQTEALASLEESNTTSTTLSGARLRLMLEAKASARFSKQGINVTLSAEAVAALGISDEDVVTVEILRESDTVFSFGVTVNEQSVTTLLGTSVSLPYTPSSDKPVLSLQNDKAETVSNGNYEPQFGLATFVVDAPGKYTILDEAVSALAAPVDSETATPKAVPILPIGIAAGALLMLGGGVCFIRRRWRK